MPKVVWGIATCLALLIPCGAGADLDSRKMIEVRDLSNVVISPDRTRAVVRLAEPDFELNKIRMTWYVVSLSEGDGAPYKLADAGEPMWNGGGVLLNETPQWSVDSRWVYFRALHGEELALWRVRGDGLHQEKLTRDPANVESFIVDPAGPRVFYSVGATREAIKRAEAREDEQGVVLDETVTFHAPLVRNFPYRGRMATIRRDIKRLEHPLASDTAIRIRVFDLADGQARDATERDLADYRGIAATARIAANNRAIAIEKSPIDAREAFLAPVDAHDEPGPRRAAPPRYQLRWAESKDATQSTACAEAVCTSSTLRELHWRADGREILFVSQGRAEARAIFASGTTTLYAWDIVRNSVRSIVSTSDILGAGARSFSQSKLCPLTGTEAVCTTAGSAAPPRLEGINLETGQRRVLFDPNSKLWDERFGAVEHLAWKDRWGRGATGVLLLPPGPGWSYPLALVITSYMCDGFLRGGTGADVPEHALAAAGFAVLCVNFDSAFHYEPHPSGTIGPGQHARLQTALDSWEAGVDLLLQRRLVDPGRIGVSGLSFGAESVHYAISHSRRFAAATAGQGPFTDPLNWYNYATRGELGKFLFEEVYRLPPPTQDPHNRYQEVSSALNVGKIHAAVLVQTNEMEFRTGLQFYANMIKAGKPLELVVFPNEGHIFMQPRHRLVMNERNIDWFRFWLQDYEDPDPAKAVQYARWRQLRQQRDSHRAN